MGRVKVKKKRKKEQETVTENALHCWRNDIENDFWLLSKRSVIVCCNEDDKKVVWPTEDSRVSRFWSADTRWAYQEEREIFTDLSRKDPSVE